MAESVSDGKVVQKMVRALLAISAKKSQIETPGLVAILLESLSFLLKVSAFSLRGQFAHAMS